MQSFKKVFKIYTRHSNVTVHSVDHSTRQQLEELFYKTSKFFLIISQIFLSAPLGVHKPRWKRQPIDVVLYWLHLSWCLGVYFSLAACIYDEYTQSNIELPTIQKPLYFSEYIVYLLHLCEVIRVIYVKHGDIYWKFQSLIIDFDQDLLNFKLSINYNDLKKFLRLHMGLIVLHITATITVGYFYSNGKLISFIRTNTVYILPNIIIQISLVQYYALLFMIYKRLQKLYGLFDKYLNKYCLADAWNFRQQLHSIRCLYARMEEFTKMVNKHFSFSILLVYFGSFMNLSINIFLIYKYLKDCKASDIAWISYSFVWVCMHLAKMFLILYYNQKLQNMKNEAVIMLSSLKFQHEAVELTLRRFLFQLMSDTRSNVVCGIVVLNMNFITSLLVAMSALFIFLVQYDITYEALTKTHNSGRANFSLTH